MNRIPLVALVSLLALTGCAKKSPSGKDKAASNATPSAEQVLAEAVTEWNTIKEEAANVLPDAGPAIEAAIGDATAKLQSPDPTESLAAAAEVGEKVRQAERDLPQRTTELQVAWKELSGAMPATLEALERRVGSGRFRKPAPGAIAPRVRLAQLRADWDAAQSAMINGRLAAAVTRGEAVRAAATQLATDLQIGS